MSLNTQDIKKVLKDMFVFSLVPLIFYINGFLMTIQVQGHVLTWADFIPTNATLIAIVTWVMNSIVNLAKKYIV